MDRIAEDLNGRQALRVRLLDESRQLGAIFVRAHLTARRNDPRGPWLLCNAAILQSGYPLVFATLSPVE
jgi:hypothetical protein